ncbi:dihydropteroate synthase [Actinomycetaceae bacterium MB13-C1-2]|nr:dihydropteroate synthase [Actinomycetaceae bacterium MB13-C1-2]
MAIGVPAVISRGRTLGGDTTQVMGILNVTPDSFSDGGFWHSETAATAHGVQMSAEGAAIIDVGGESTRPGARRVSADEEWERIGPVVRNLVREGIAVSIDTVHSETAKRGLELGAVLINDVSGGSLDSGIARVCAEYDAAMVVQHWRGFPSDPLLDTKYGDVTSELIRETMVQVEAVLDSGLQPTRVVVDPGLGFALGGADSWRIVESLDDFVSTGFPVLVGASRKRFIAERYGNELEQGTLDVTRSCVSSGAWMVRVHSVGPNVRLIQELSK